MENCIIIWFFYSLLFICWELWGSSLDNKKKLRITISLGQWTHRDWAGQEPSLFVWNKIQDFSGRRVTFQSLSMWASLSFSLHTVRSMGLQDMFLPVGLNTSTTDWNLQYYHAEIQIKQWYWSLLALKSMNTCPIKEDHLPCNFQRDWSHGEGGTRIASNKGKYSWNLHAIIPTQKKGSAGPGWWKWERTSGSWKVTRNQEHMEKGLRRGGDGVVSNTLCHNA